MPGEAPFTRAAQAVAVKSAATRKDLAKTRPATPEMRKMKNAPRPKSHSCEIQGWPAAVQEKGLVFGIERITPKRKNAIGIQNGMTAPGTP